MEGGGGGREGAGWGGRGGKVEGGTGGSGGKGMTGESEARQEKRWVRTQRVTIAR